MIVKIPGCTEVSAEDVGEWMACDTSDPGFQILNDDEIVVSVREDVEVEVEEELSADVEVDAGPSASEAFAGLETALKWMERPSVTTCNCSPSSECVTWLPKTVEDRNSLH
ncbi:hypothetical protein EVAR_40027_1 [Eumeta japonica]|uniref:Uncharacterized protein n=1 Tax=Eumeta variegata TaxID=151549 RepID=A0A4C1YQV9_EUMVA|nr:hypothetical protein EVAR_40027_1 [Eumeta japonica]